MPSHPIIPLQSLLIPVQYLEMPEGLVREHGGATSEVFAACGLQEHQAHEAGRTIDGNQIMRAMAVSRRYCLPGRSLASQFLKHLPITQHGPLGILIMASATLGEALSAIEQYSSVLFPAFSVRVQMIREDAHVFIQRLSHFGEFDDLITEIVLGSFQSINPFINGDIRGIDVHLRHSALSEHPPFHLCASSGFYYCAASDKLVVPKRLLETPLLTSSRSLKIEAAALLAQMARTNQQAKPTSHQTRLIIRDLMRNRMVIHGDVIANQLSLSRRTLSRKLELEGTSLADLIMEVRMAHAETLLTTTTHPISDVARRAGFTEMSNFSRAFKRFYGQTPRERRISSTSRGAIALTSSTVDATRSKPMAPSHTQAE